MNNKQFAAQNRGQEVSPSIWTLEIDVDTGGTTVPPLGSHQYNDGEIVTVTATPNVGWEFKSWDGDVTGTNPVIQVAMNRDKIVVARFFETASSVRVTTRDIVALEAQDTPTLIFEGYINPDDIGNVTSIGFYYSTHGNPTSADTEIGVHELDNPFTATVTDLAFKTIYYCRAYARYDGGEAWGEVKSSTTQNACPIGELYHENITQQSADFGILFTKAYGSPITNINQIKVYLDTVNPPSQAEEHTVYIGYNEIYPIDIPKKVLWTEVPDGYLNLQPNTTYYYSADIYADGYCREGVNPACWTPECLGVNSFTTLGQVEPLRSGYGILYGGYVTNTYWVQDMFISGLYVPSTAAWEELSAYFSGFTLAGAALKKTGTDKWSSPNSGATNISSFFGLPGGWRSGSDGNFVSIKDEGRFWDYNRTSGKIHFHILRYDGTTFEYRSDYSDNSYNMGASIRLMRDLTTQEKDDYNDGEVVEVVTDFNGHNYNLIRIGEQGWTQSNLVASNFRDGTAIMEIQSNPVWVDYIRELTLCVYNNDPNNY